METTKKYVKEKDMSFSIFLSKTNRKAGRFRYIEYHKEPAFNAGPKEQKAREKRIVRDQKNEKRAYNARRKDITKRLKGALQRSEANSTGRASSLYPSTILLDERGNHAELDLQ